MNEDLAHSLISWAIQYLMPAEEAGVCVGEYICCCVSFATEFRVLFLFARFTSTEVVVLHYVGVMCSTSFAAPVICATGKSCDVELDALDVT